MTWYSERGLFVLLGIICFVALIMGVAPSWVGSTTNYTIVEDTVYAHNLTQNITGYADDVTFTFNVNNQFNLSWQNATGTFNVTSSEISDWIVLNGSSGILNFRPVYDNQT